MDITHPVARTAFYCCLIRADDATAARPVCGDTFAARFLDDTIRHDLAPLLQFRNARVGNVARHRMIDDIAREHLARHPAARVIVLGAGFDTRAYRLPGGRWFELDDPQLLAFKEQRLPAAESPNPLSRIPVVFTRETPDHYLSLLAGDDEALVVLEGVSMYLADSTLRELASALARAFPNATLVCDLMSPAFARTFSRGVRRALQQMGAFFDERSEHPRRAFELAGWLAVRRLSIPGRAMEADAVRVPRWLLATVLRTLRDGYMVWVFRTSETERSRVF